MPTLVTLVSLWVLSDLTTSGSEQILKVFD
jgi:hypothetical protein